MKFLLCGSASVSGSLVYQFSIALQFSNCHIVWGKALLVLQPQGTTPVPTWKILFALLAPVVQRLDNSIHRVDITIQWISVNKTN